MPPEEGSVRRLEAILCGDIVGYSKHMSYDEEGTLARLMHHRREIIEPTVAVTGWLPPCVIKADVSSVNVL